ncbi:MAG: riboflavin synthase [Bacteroidota bacterium]
MFTGIIEEIGTVERRDPAGTGVRLRIRAPKSAGELKVHDSVNINGACHTVVWHESTSFEVESVEETIKKTAIGNLIIGDRVNLELPMRLNERLGGHLVLGHVDTTGKILGIEKRDGSWLVFIRIPDNFHKYLVHVGSIGIDGVSLTVAKLDENKIGVSIIPYTMENTIFQHYRTGTVVNVELDIIGKYIERMIQSDGTTTDKKPFMNETQLRELGY